MGGIREKITYRALLLLLCFVVIFGIILLKSFYLMVLRPWYSPTWNSREEQQRQVKGPRGSIVDRKGNVFAISTQRQSLYVNPKRVKNKWETARLLEKNINQSAPEIYRALRQERKYFVWLARKLSEDKVRKIQELDLAGVGFIPEYERFYPNDRLAAQVIGFVGLDNQGLVGVEKQFDDFLRGGGEREDFQNLKLKLTLDQSIQHIAEEELARLVERAKPKQAMAVVMAPESGKVLAMANWPFFDPNNFQEYNKSSWRNRVISQPFEPGSTLKVMTLSGALGSDAINFESAFTCPGKIYLSDADYTLKCYAAHGELKIPEILIKSCNVGTVKAISQMTPPTFYQYLRKFGFGNWTGVKLPGEAQGTLRRPSHWSALSQPSMAIGQGISVTALQLTSALSAVVNDGTLLQPRVVAGRRRASGEFERREKIKVREVVPPKVARKMQGYMRKVVTRGTGRRAASEQFRLAGKTGTAQKADLEEGGYYQDKVLASFIGFGPVESPRLAVSVVVDEPKKGRYGGEVAAPAFRRIMERSLHYLRESPRK